MLFLTVYFFRRKLLKRKHIARDQEVDVSIVAKKLKKPEENDLQSDNENNAFVELSTECNKEKEHNKLELLNNQSDNNVVGISSDNKQLNMCVKKSDNPKLKKKYRELFGDDLNDLHNLHESDFNSTSPIQRNQNVKNDHGSLNAVDSNPSDRKTNCSLVNEPSLNKNALSVKRSLSNKGLKTRDLSPKHTSDLKMTLNLHPIQQEDNTISFKKRTPSQDKNETCKSTVSNNEPKNNQKKHNLNLNSIDENLTNKTLWSILGMECPSERSESIIRSYPLNHTNDESSTSSAKNQPDSSVASSPRQCIDKLENSYAMLITKEKPIEPPKSVLPGTVAHNRQQMFEPSKNSLAPETNFERNDETVCRIAETFSLARMEEDFSNEIPRLSSNQIECNRNNVKKYSKTNRVTLTNECIELDYGKSNVNSSMTNQNLSEPAPDIDTINILNKYNCNFKLSNIEEANTASENKNSNNQASKVGSIRVKSNSLLMKPEMLRKGLGSSEGIVRNESCSTALKPTQLGGTKHLSDVEIRFSLTCTYYFDNFVQSKIPQLGELLHLAIADLIRKEERIKRAEQLSSDDLINDEKQRAVKDFNEMMRIRGNEFTPLYESVYKRFDKGSKQTLFLTLFSTILKHAETIDPANKNCILKGRDVLRIMFSKCQHRDNDVLELLSTDDNIFYEQVTMINKLIEKCTTIKGVPNNENTLESPLIINNKPTIHSTNHTVNIANVLKRSLERSVNSPVGPLDLRKDIPNTPICNPPLRTDEQLNANMQVNLANINNSSRLNVHTATYTNVPSYSSFPSNSLQFARQVMSSFTAGTVNLTPTSTTASHTTSCVTNSNSILLPIVRLKAANNAPHQQMGKNIFPRTPSRVVAAPLQNTPTTQITSKGNTPFTKSTRRVESNGSSKKHDTIGPNPSFSSKVSSCYSYY